MRLAGAGAADEDGVLCRVGEAECGKLFGTITNAYVEAGVPTTSTYSYLVTGR